MNPGAVSSEHLKMPKQKGPKAIKLLGNIRIRAENLQKKQKRAQNVLLTNQFRSQQVANQYKLELSRAEGALHGMPDGLQRQAVLMTKGMLQKRYDHIKL
jgi:hypothetical protein